MQLPRWVVYAGAATILVLVAAVAYLIGRETRRHPVAAAAVVSPTTAPPATAPPAAAPTTTATVETATPAMPAPVAPPQRVADVAPPPHADPLPEAPPAPAIPARASNEAVRSYFDAMARIPTLASTGSPTDLASSVLQSAMSGDASAFENIVKVASDGVTRARAIVPPPECRAYHDHMIALLEEGTRLMTRLRDAMAGKDAGALTSIASSGTALQGRADALAAEEKAIRAKAGI